MPNNWPRSACRTRNGTGRSDFLRGLDRKWSLNLADDLTLRCAFDWRGKTVRRVRTLLGDTADPVEGLSLFQVLDQWADLRNAVAHRSLQRTAQVRTKDPRYRKPYEATIAGQQQTRLLWGSDAKKDTVQAGTARACLGFYAQLVDAVISRVADRQRWDEEALRLPATWFSAEPRWLQVWTYQLHRDTSNGDRSATRAPAGPDSQRALSP
jgi:hypothetical protein